MASKTLKKKRLAGICLLLGGFVCLLPAVTPPVALVLGVFLALTLSNPWQEQSMRTAHRLLAFSVAGLGAGMNLVTVLQAGAAGLGYSFIGITLTIALGVLIGRALKAEKNTAWLVTVGTAICGGSAIAAVAPVLRARQEAIAVAFATVFLLNAVALIVFPPLGHVFGLDAAQFGLWAALAVHDTSSVVGAALAYGGDALDHAVVLKMARALWILPVALAIGFYVAKADAVAEGAKLKMKFPWFIPAFLLIAAVFTWMPQWQEAGGMIVAAAKRGMVLVLYLIGTTLSLTALKAVGWRPLALGIILWVLAAGGTLAAIQAGWISG